MIGHPELSELLELRDGGGDIQTAAHVHTCPRCAALVEDALALRRALRELPESAPDHDLWPAALAAVHRNELRRRARTLGALGSLAAMLVIGLVASFRPAPPGPDARQLEEMARLVTRSQALELELKHLDLDSRVMTVEQAATVAALEEQVAAIDARLAAPEADDTMQLWRTRVGLLDRMVGMGSTQAVYAGF